MRRVKSCCQSGGGSLHIYDKHSYIETMMRQTSRPNLIRQGGVTPNLGVLPPLAVSSAGLPFDRRSVNIRWLTATALVGLGGAVLLGLAIIASVDKRSMLAFVPELVSDASQRLRTVFDGSVQRGDRLVPLVENLAARQALRIPTPVKIDDRDTIRLRPFVRVSTKLALNLSGAVTDVPAFNPQQIFAAGDQPLPKADQPLIRADENEAFVQKRPLVSVADPGGPFLTLSDSQIEEQVEEIRVAALVAARASLVPTMLIAPQQMLARTLPLAGSDPLRRDATVSDTAFSNIRVTVAPENVTTIPMRVTKGPDAPPPAEKFMLARKNDTFEQLLMANGVPQPEARNAYASIGPRLKDGLIREGQKLKILTTPPDNKASPVSLLRAIVYDEDRALAMLVKNDRGQFVAIAPPASLQPAAPAPAPATNANTDNDDETGGVSLYQSLFETGFRNDIPRPIIDQLLRVFFFDTDLQKRVNDGDSFEVFYNDDDERETRKEVLYASLTTGNITRRYYRFQIGRNGTVDHYDETGRSNRAFLLRKPITEGTLRSGYGMRYHPVLHYSKMHTGIDWSDKIGTPIIAAGDGMVIKAEWDSGYGRRVEIQHNYNFITTYSHLSAFAADIVEGTIVRQGQVIGYLGSSGLSTGPHLHYEVKVNDNYVDPLGIRLPSNRELDRTQLAEFKRERDKIDDLIRQSTSGNLTADRTIR